MSKEIALTKGCVAIVDDDWHEMLSLVKWHVSITGKKLYAVRRASEYMHRMIMDAPSDKEVDHIDGDGLNNCRNNLRLCNRKENRRNSTKRTHVITSSIYKGVNFYKRLEKWRADICVDGKQVSLGYFNKELDAVHAYNKAAIKYHGEFAKLNSI